jgi:hypothetical protein
MENNIKMDRKEAGWVGVDWVYVVQISGLWWAVVARVMELRVVYSVENFLLLKRILAASG